MLKNGAVYTCLLGLSSLTVINLTIISGPTSLATVFLYIAHITVRIYWPTAYRGI